MTFRVTQGERMCNGAVTSGMQLNRVERWTLLILKSHPTFPASTLLTTSARLYPIQTLSWRPSQPLMATPKLTTSKNMLKQRALQFIPSIQTPHRRRRQLLQASLETSCSRSSQRTRMTMNEVGDHTVKREVTDKLL